MFSIRKAGVQVDQFYVMLYTEKARLGFKLGKTAWMGLLVAVRIFFAVAFWMYLYVT